MKILKEILPYFIILTVVIIIRMFIVTPVIVSGPSMNNTLKDGQIILLKKYDKTYSRFDVVVFNHGKDKWIKRIIGLPGEHIKYENGILYVNNKAVNDEFANITSDYDLNSLSVDKIPDGYYFVLGDNRTRSTDSRYVGLIPEKDILGSTSFSLWPIKSIK